MMSANPARQPGLVARSGPTFGIKTWRQAGILNPIAIEATGVRRAFREGIVVEALNPKPAAFFLAFVPQFVDPSANIALQFIVLGTISVGLNTGVDVVVAYSAANARASLSKRPSLIVKMRRTSGAVMFGLGASLLLARRDS
ncbi:LysE family translocator [Bradyrhizobium sp. AUGA SZCCT0177]|nr:LysE family translocator [Bradyrhizobium sp. AUGA SZCCT0177]